MKAMPKPMTRFQAPMPGIGYLHAAQVEHQHPDESDQHEADHDRLEPHRVGCGLAFGALHEGVVVFAGSCHTHILPPRRSAARRSPARGDGQPRWLRISVWARRRSERRAGRHPSWSSTTTTASSTPSSGYLHELGADTDLVEADAIERMPRHPSSRATGACSSRPDPAHPRAPAHRSRWCARRRRRHPAARRVSRAPGDRRGVRRDRRRTRPSSCTA